MKLFCNSCGRDLNEIWQDNISCVPGIVLCEDCAGYTAMKKQRAFAKELEKGADREI